MFDPSSFERLYPCTSQTDQMNTEPVQLQGQQGARATIQHQQQLQEAQDPQEQPRKQPRERSGENSVFQVYHHHNHTLRVVIFFFLTRMKITDT
jgi:hypothetical protein